jgi:hypothetical protein
MAGRCGLVDARNPCRCARKTQAFIRDGVVDPVRLQFAPLHVEEARQGAGGNVPKLALLQQQSAELGALYPHFDAPDIAARISELLALSQNTELLQ